MMSTIAQTEYRDISWTVVASRGRDVVLRGRLYLRLDLRWARFLRNPPLEVRLSYRGRLKEALNRQSLGSLSWDWSFIGGDVDSEASKEELGDWLEQALRDAVALALLVDQLSALWVKKKQVLFQAFKHLIPDYYTRTLLLAQKSNELKETEQTDLYRFVSTIIDLHRRDSSCADDSLIEIKAMRGCIAYLFMTSAVSKSPEPAVLLLLPFRYLDLAYATAIAQKAPESPDNAKLAMLVPRLDGNGSFFSQQWKSYTIASPTIDSWEALTERLVPAWTAARCQQMQIMAPDPTEGKMAGAFDFWNRRVDFNPYLSFDLEDWRRTLGGLGSWYATELRNTLNEWPNMRSREDHVRFTRRLVAAPFPQSPVIPTFDPNLRGLWEYKLSLTTFPGVRTLWECRKKEDPLRFLETALDGAGATIPQGVPWEMTERLETLWGEV